MRDPLTTPDVGDVVQSAYYDGRQQIGRRTVVKVSSANIKYLTGTGRKTVERDCLPVTWLRWCRRHRARVVTDDNRDY